MKLFFDQPVNRDPIAQLKQFSPCKPSSHDIGLLICVKNPEKDFIHNHGVENGSQFHPADRKNGSGIENRGEKVPKFRSVVAT
ncbi:hypothetical protein [Desulfosarcina ovata]|uniref:hypothetical protein n=1 Tax=Desulfosarcina ovata TaxID=83564 RepID=UPI0012D311F6|nr:hypothetical protein [Desulfosarcina ovata]